MVNHLEQASVELFAAYELEAELVEFVPLPRFDEDALPATLAVLGFVGDGVRGSLVMVALESAVRTWLGAMGDADGDPADVLGEFANMLLGRLKTRLLPEGLPLQVSTPATASGKGIRLAGAPEHSEWVSLAGASWQAKVRLDMTFDASFTLRRGEGHEDPAQAGDAIFF